MYIYHDYRLTNFSMLLIFFIVKWLATLDFSLMILGIKLNQGALLGFMSLL